MLPKSVVVVLARGRMGRGVVGVGEEVGVDAGCALTRLAVEARGLLLCGVISRAVMLAM